MSSHELMNFFFAKGVQVLEFVQGRELFHVQTVRSDNVWFTFQQMFSLEAGDVGDGGENVTEMRRRPFHAVSVVDLAFARFLVHFKLKWEKLN